MRACLLFFLLSARMLLAQQVPTPDHVVIVIFENKSYFNIIEDPNFVPPYINKLACDAQYGALFTQSYGLTHPSQPNYLHLFSGSNQGITENDRPKKIPFVTPNLGASLLQTEKTFVGYAEDLPSVGYNGDSTTSEVNHEVLYVRKHNPWVNWQGAKANGIPDSLNQPFTSFPSDFNRLPTISIVIPNMNHDMHNKGRTIADNWLKENLSAYVEWLKDNNSLLIITFDEDDSSPNNKNRIPTIFYGPMVKSGAYAEPPSGINHHNILRTLEEMYNLPHAGNAINVSAIKDCWITSVQK